MMRDGKDAKLHRTDNGGFSLVEVIVCVALLAIISVPIMSALNTSAKLNQKAHYTQKLTNYAQEELEVIKAMSADGYETYRGVTKLREGDIAADLNAVSPAYLNAIATRDSCLAQTEIASLDAAEQERLAEPYFYRVNNLDIGSDKYAMLVTVEPAVYSMVNPDGVEYGTDINIAGMVDIRNADASLFPVLAEEINLYDKDDAGDALLKNLKEKYLVLGVGTSDTEIEKNILKALTKNALVKIDVIGSGENARTEVTATVNYTCNYGGKEIKLDYIVYSGSYKYDEASEGLKGGGSVYLFADAFEGNGVSVTDAPGNHCVNNLTVDTSGVPDDHPVEVYLIRSTPKDGETGYNFDSVTVNSLTYLGSPEMKKGEVPLAGGGKLYTNIKCARFDLTLRLDEEKKAEMRIGSGEYDARCALVTVELYKQAEDGTALPDGMSAQVSSTKIIKKAGT